MSTDPLWSDSGGQPCSVCGVVVALISEDGAYCPLCWAHRTGADPDHTLGQAIAVEALLTLETSPHRVSEFVERLHHLAEHATKPALTGLLSQAARDLESLAAESS